MLLFIGTQVKTDIQTTGFQYITCYSLSYIYDMDARTQDTFQYITCYSLSPGEHRGKHPENLFQYITCYSLSNITYRAQAQGASFNTSHVTLYHPRDPFS